MTMSSGSERDDQRAVVLDDHDQVGLIYQAWQWVLTRPGITITNICWFATRSTHTDRGRRSGAVQYHHLRVARCACL